MFHDQVQSYLRRLRTLTAKPRGAGLTVDLEALRSHLIGRLKQLPQGRAVRALHESWSERLPGLVDFLQRELAPATSAEEALGTGALILDVALRISDLELGGVDQLEARRLLTTFEWEGYDIARYAAETGLTRPTPRLELELTVLATTLLRLSGREAVKWLLTIETERSTGVWDHWRASQALLGELLSGLEEENDPEFGQGFQCSRRTLQRLIRMGVAKPFTREDGEVWKYEVETALREAVTESLSDDPWRATVRAALADQVQRVVSAAGGSSLKATNELSRIVTHEIRNALVPVRHHATALIGEATGPGQKERAEKVLRGVSRVLHFVDELVTISETVTTERLKTPLDSFLAEAIDPLEGVERVVFAFDEQDLELPREPLARALRNVVQNALQLTQSPARVDLAVLVRDGYLVFQVDDGGSGVPPHLRERVFEDGFTTREGGSGYGLAMTRRILTELGGWVRCEASPLGGARFVIALPLSEPT